MFFCYRRTRQASLNQIQYNNNKTTERNRRGTWVVKNRSGEAYKPPTRTRASTSQNVALKAPQIKNSTPPTSHKRRNRARKQTASHGYLHFILFLI